MTARVNGPNARVICVLGMHRSGTSLITRVLNCLGLYLGPKSHLMQPGQDNPRGYWEHDSITALNHEILSRLGGTWHEPPSFGDGWERSLEFDDLREKARALINDEFKGVDFWGWKDPVTCLTLPFWQNLLPSLSYVICVRSPLDVARSLERRDDFALEKGAQLWLLHVKSSLEFTKGQPRLLLFYEEFMNDWHAEVRRLSTFVGNAELAEDWKILDAIGEHIDPDLYHYRSSLTSTVSDPTLLYPAKSCYLMLRLYRNSGSLSVLDETLRMFADASVRACEQLGRLRNRVTSLLSENSVLGDEKKYISREVEFLKEEASSQRNEIDNLVQNAMLLEKSVAYKDECLRQATANSHALQAKHDNEIVDLLNNVRKLADELALLQHHVEQQRIEIEQRIQHVCSMEKSLLERDLVIQNMQAVQSGLLWDLFCIYRGLKDQALPVGSLRRKTYDLVLGILKVTRNRLTRIGASITEDSDNSERQSRPRGVSPGTIPIEGQCHYSIDSLAVKNGRAYGWGWVIVRDQCVAAIKALLVSKEKVFEISCQHGVARPDVARHYVDWPAAHHSGFIIAGEIPPRSFDALLLDIRLENGACVKITVDPTFIQFAAEPTASHAVRSTWRKRRKFEAVPRKLASATRRILSGDFKWLWSAATKHGTLLFHPGANCTPEFDLGEILLLLKNADRNSFVLVVDHNLGGGANFYRKELIDKTLDAGTGVILLYYHLPTLDYHFRMMFAGCDRTFRLESPLPVLKLMKATNLQEIFCNTIVSMDDPLEMLAFLLQLREDSGAPLTIAAHDYFMVCPSWTLIDQRGRYCGVPSLATCRDCLRTHRGMFSSIVRERNIDQWRSKWSGALARADKILCFSNASVKIIRKAYPDIDAAKFVVQPHKVSYLPDQAIRSFSLNEFHIGIVGEIVAHKGSEIVQAMAKIISRRGLAAKITVVGTVDLPCDSSVVTVTGSYERSDLPNLLKSRGITVCFLPSIWPETFSYVTEELIQLMMPVAVFDLGAPAERVRAYCKGLVIENIDAEFALDKLLGFHEQLIRETSGENQNDIRLR